MRKWLITPLAKSHTSREKFYEMSTDILESFEELGLDSLIGREIPRIRVCNTIRLPQSIQFRCRNFTFWIEQGVRDLPLGISETEKIQGVVLTEEGDKVLSEDGAEIFSEDGFTPSEAELLAPAVDLSFSKNGNQSFGTIVRHRLNPEGKFRNQLNWYRMGMANEMTMQLRFWGMQRFVANDGIMEIY
jgi:hypothetical protein